jgi:hypothetical protein
MGIAPDRKTVRAMSRHNDEHKQWAPSEHTAHPFSELPGEGWYVFTAELMHSKGNGFRDINYIHDILVADGKPLYGHTFDYRQELLMKLFADKIVDDSPKTHFVIDDHTWLAKNYTEGYAELFEGAADDAHIEGLVLKNRYSMLLPCMKPTSNAAWSAKVRKPTKNAAF